MPAPSELHELVERFKRNYDQYLSQDYKEADLRKEFIDPVFEMLGWDMANKKGYAEQYKEVKSEPSLEIEGGTKSPDYEFRIGEKTIFYVEAKKPHVEIGFDKLPAFQLRRYAFSRSLPLSILTNFKLISVYDGRFKPDKNDSVAVARIMRPIAFEELEVKWDELANIFSRDAVLNGSFDRLAEDKKAKRGTSEVNEEFLKEIEGWREILAKNIASRNAKLTINELNFAVQKIIDRIIFLRMCEDRGTEKVGQLREVIEKAHIYRRLIDIFQLADTKYNSGVFHFSHDKIRATHPDELTPGLKIDDDVFKKIIENLYYPDSPYQFDVISADILGQVYEQFLGKVIRLTEGHHAKVEEKLEVKKAGGVYYTPTYIADYIVENTLGVLCKGRSPMEMGNLRILDPACGSGSFLIRAYIRLLKEHLDWYIANSPKKWKNEMFQGPKGEWTLTLKEKKRILLNNIYGVDIDGQAVEVTKLNLLLKALEGESKESIENMNKWLREPALPDLGNNIKCGNSLVDFDIQEMLKDMPLEEQEKELNRIRPFSWNNEFPQIFKDGGFDCIIGNPPYIRIQTLKQWAKFDVEYYKKYYDSAKRGNCDLCVSFVERGYNLLNPLGRFGMILPNKFFKTDYGVGLRTFLSEKKAVSNIVDFGASQVFDATTYTCLLFLSKQRHSDFLYAMSEANPDSLRSIQLQAKKLEVLTGEPWDFLDEDSRKLLTKISRKTKRLLDLPADMSRGSSTGYDEAFVLKRNEAEVEKEMVRIPLFATDFNRYSFSPSSNWLIIFPYIYENGAFRLLNTDEIKKNYPKAYSYLNSHQAELKKRKQFTEWYGFSAPRNLILHDHAQIAIPLLAERGQFASIPPEYRGKLCPMASGGFTISISPECPMNELYILGILNSRLTFWRLRQMSNIFRGGWITCTKQYFGELPIRWIDFSDPADKTRHNKMVSLVERMLQLQRNLPNTRTPDEKTRTERLIEAADSEIDLLVYELYGLSEEEVRIIENGQ